MLGFPFGAVDTTCCSFYGNIHPPFSFNNVTCNGTEAFLVSIL
jgi:hypothetical protein